MGFRMSQYMDPAAEFQSVNQNQHLRLQFYRVGCSSRVRFYSSLLYRPRSI